MSELEPERVRPVLRGSFGAPYLHSIECTSTQDVLRGGDHPHGTVAATEHQTAGRGRSGRAWEDAASRSLLFSVLLRPPAGAPLPQLSLVAGLAVAAAIEDVSGRHAMVKWPNDVLLGDRKVAGILLEASAGVVVCGIGINVNQDGHELPAATRTPATSLRVTTGLRFDRATLLAAALVELETHYAAWLHGGLEVLRQELAERHALRGRRIGVDGERGVAGEIAADGRLGVELDGGGFRLVESGEIEPAG